MTLRYILVACKYVMETFIPKPGCENYNEAKAYCPISLFIICTYNYDENGR